MANNGVMAANGVCGVMALSHGVMANGNENENMA